MILVVFYSRTGTTRKVANTIARNLQCAVEEIFDTKDRRGAYGYLMSGRDATLEKLTRLKEIQHNPLNYDTIIIGTPIWAWTMSTPIRTYLHNYRDKFKQVAFFCTMGGSGSERAFKKMEELCGKKPLATLAITTKEVVDKKYENKINDFLKKYNKK